MIIRSRAICGAIALALVAPFAASAQTPRNPFTELFGRKPERAAREFTAVQFRSTAGVQTGWEVEDRQFETPQALIPEGVVGGADAGLSAEYIRTRAQLTAIGRYSYQEYRREPAFGAPSFQAAARANVRPTTRLSLQAGGSIARSPYFQMMWLAPTQAVAAASDRAAAILLLQNDSREVNGGITSDYTKRSSVSVSGYMRETDFAFSPEQDFAAVGGRAQWRRQVTRDLGVHAGYTREELRQRLNGVRALRTNEVFDIGIGYAVTLARRTSFSFATATSRVSDDQFDRYRLNGNVALQHQFGQSWITQILARRATEFLPGFQAPAFTDRAHAGVAGYLARRWLLNLNADGTQGEIGIGDPRKFSSYSGDAKLTFGLTRHFGVFGQYVYYHYQMPADRLLLFVLPSGTRHAVSFGVQTWIPLYEKDKVIRDPR